VYGKHQYCIWALIKTNPSFEIVPKNIKNDKHQTNSQTKTTTFSSFSSLFSHYTKSPRSNPNPLSPNATIITMSSSAIIAAHSSSWAAALVRISPYTFSAIGIAVSIGVSVLGAAW